MATTYDIATLAGVNQSTVSRVLSGREGIHPTTARKVHWACRELNYVPNTPARSLRTKRAHAIAISIPLGEEDVSADPFVPRLLSGVSPEASSRGYGVIFSPHHGDPAAECSELVKAKRADGIIITCPTYHDPRVMRLVSERIPGVVGRCDCELGPKMACVDIDNRRAGYRAARFFLSRGHSRIALVTEPPESIPGRDCQRGFFQAIREAGIEPDPRMVRQIPVAFKAGHDAAMELLRMDRPPTAIITNTGVTVFGVLRALGERGKEVSVLGVESPLLRYLYPSLPRMQTPVVEMGRQMAKTLLGILETGECPLREIMLHDRIVDEHGNIFEEPGEV